MWLLDIVDDIVHFAPVPRSSNVVYDRLRLVSLSTRVITTTRKSDDNALSSNGVHRVTPRERGVATSRLSAREGKG